MRGFSYRGVGPKNNGASLGGDLYYHSSAHLSLPLPPAVPSAAKAQIFASMGNLVSWAGKSSLSHALTHSLTHSLSLLYVSLTHC